MFLGEMMSVTSAARCQSNAHVEEQRSCLIGRCRETFFLMFMFFLMFTDDVLLSVSGTGCTWPISQGCGSAVAGNDAIIDHRVFTRQALTRPSTFRVLLISTACG